MSGISDRESLGLLNAIVDMLQATGAPIDDQLLILEMAWLSLAAIERSGSLMVADGAPALQNRQINRLEKMLDLLRSDVPDPELDRLIQAGDVKGVVDRVTQKRREH